MSTPPQPQGFMQYPAAPWQQAIFKAPITLWRMGLGPLLGQVFVLITHTGRKSGLPRRTLAEYHVVNGVKVSPVAFGERAQWYKNIAADPLVTIQTAGGAESCQARRLSGDDELLAAVRVIRERNRVMFDAYLDGLGLTPDEADILAHQDRIYLLAFEPTNAPTPPPLEPDLKWVWGALGALGVVMLLGRLRPRRKRA